jgi:FkbM family methyltransferase
LKRASARRNAPNREWWVWNRVPESGRAFIDCGANVGQWTTYLAARFECGHAIEPNPQVLSELERGLPQNVTLHKLGLSSTHCLKTFDQYESSQHFSACSGGDLNVHTGERIGTVSVQCVPLDDLFIDGSIDFIKIDVEGLEVDVLDGGQGIIQANRPRLLIEVHTVDNFQAVCSRLLQWDYLFDVVRHPHYAVASEQYWQHFWIVAQAR